MTKRGVTPDFPPQCGIEKIDSFTLLGVTLQTNCKFSSHIKGKLREANKCLYILRSLRKDGYTQIEIDNLFKAAKDHIRTSGIWSQPGRFKHHTMLFKKVK